MYQGQPHITPLPMRVQPHPWEDLGSFLGRLTCCMDYPTPQWLLKPEIASHQIREGDLPTLSRQADYDFLSQLLLLSEERLYQLTVHRFSPIFAALPPGRETLLVKQKQPGDNHEASHEKRIRQNLLSREVLKAFLFSSSTIRICPLCLLQPESYGRLYWRIKHLLTCPLHGVYLQTRCPCCSNTWPSLRLPATCCSSCSHPIHQEHYSRKAQAHSEWSRLVQGDWLTLHMLGYELPPDLARSSSLSLDIRARLLPDHYFTLLSVFCSIIAELDHQLLISFLSPSFYTLLTFLMKSFSVTSKKNLPVQIAITPWLFAGEEAHFFSFLDTLSFLSLQKGPSKAAFHSFPFAMFPHDSLTFQLLYNLHQRYRSLYEKKGLKALEQRVLQRKERLHPFIT